jgi:DNA polymerase III sliding clamp (beta) subunit (PCNA family)
MKEIQLKIKRNVFANYLKDIQPVLGSELYVGGLDSIFLNGETIHAYNDKYAMTAYFETGIEGTIRAKELYQLVNKLKQEEIEIEETESTIKIVSGNTNVELNRTESDVPMFISKLELPTEWQELPENFFDLASLCTISANISKLKGIVCKDSHMISTDTVRLNYGNLSDSMENFWIDDKVISDILKLSCKPTQYSLEGDWLHLKSSNFIFSSKIFNISLYPVDKLTAIYEEFNTAKFEEYTLPKSITDVIDRAGIFSTEDDKLHFIDITLKENLIQFSAKSSTGTIKDSIEIDLPITKKIQFKVDYNFISNAISKCPVFAIYEDNIIFKNDNYKQIIKVG